MKKIFMISAMTLLAMGFAFSPQEVQAKTYKMVAVAKSTVSSEKNIKNVLLEVQPQKIGGSHSVVEHPVMLKTEVISVKHAKRGKMNGSVRVKVLSYKPYNSANYIDVTDKNFEMGVKAYSPLDYKNIGLSAATTVASKALQVPFLSQGVAAVKGAAKPQEGQSRLKSAGVSVYQSTPISYVEKGKELNAKVGDKVTLSFKVEEPDDEQEDANENEATKTVDPNAPIEEQEKQFTKNQLSN